MNKQIISTELSISASQHIKESEYWLKQLSGELVKCFFPYHLKAKDKNEEKDTVSFRFPQEVVSRLMKVVQGADTRLHMVLVTAVVVLLYKYTYAGCKDIIVGVPIYKQETEMKGQFVNTVLALRNRLDEGMSFKQLLLQVRQTITEAVENQNYPIETLLYRLDIPFEREGDFPLFDVAVLLENIHDRSYLNHIKLNMIFSFCRIDHGLEGVVEYNKCLYKKALVEYIFSHLAQLMQEALFNVDTTLDQLGILADAEKQRLLEEFNHTAAGYASHKTIVQLFEEQVERTPDHMAVVGPMKYRTYMTYMTYISYRELNKKANQLAVVLKRKGVQRDSVIGLMLERSGPMMVAIMAVLKSGGAYLPLDPETLESRIKHIGEDTQSPLLLTETAVTSRRNPGSNLLMPGTEVFCMDELDRQLAHECEDNPEHINQPGDLAYIIFTSGSTGKPKGVIVEHRNVNNLLLGLKERIYFKYKKEKLKIALVAPYVFDASVKQVFGALLQGYCLCIVPEDTRRDGEKLVEFYITHGIDISDGTPTLLEILLENRRFGTIPVKEFLIGGETLKCQVAADFLKVFQGQAPVITNVYGPTECCVDSTSYTVTKANIAGESEENIPIGSPWPNVEVYIVNQKDQLQPIGCEGEIYIGGDGVARGYLKREQLTAEKFVKNPFVPGKTIYRTGDLGRWLPEGNIQFLGRLDHQVKIRGYRIELEEIEYHLLTHPGVEEAVVTDKEDSRGEKYLCAYVVPGVRPKEAAKEKPVDLQYSEPVLRRFEEQAMQQPHKIAVDSLHSQVTYGALDKRANHIAGLINEQYDDRFQLSKEEKNRYQRQLLLDGWGMGAQEILKSTTVFIAGAGGIGSHIIQQLALVGIGTIIVCDYDQVELSNLNRQLLHDESRIGMNKALSARMTIKRINPYVNVIPYQQKITRENIDEMVGSAEIIFDCVDDLETKFILSECAIKKQIPHMLSAMIDINAYAAILYPPLSPCFFCLHDRSKAEEIRQLKQVKKDYRKIPFPVVEPALSVTTGFISNEALKILVGHGSPAYNKFFLFNQKGSKGIVETTGYKQMTYAFNSHFRKMSRDQGFDWDECWRGNFIEELRISANPNCPMCAGGTRQNRNETGARRSRPQSKTTTAPAAGNNPAPRTQCAALVMTDDTLLPEAILGTLKAGKIPIFISPHHPGEQERLKWTGILEDSQARIIITTVKDSETAKQIRDSFNKRIPVITVDEPAKQKINKKLLRGVQGAPWHGGPIRDGFFSEEVFNNSTCTCNLHLSPLAEKSPPGLIEAAAADITNALLKGEIVDLKKNSDKHSGYFYSLSELREYLLSRIPEYMIPAYFVQMEKLPLTSSGKIDRKALPEPEVVAGDTYTAPANEIEEMLVEMWGEILKVDKEVISMDANFFELGGHSLKATILIARIHRLFDVKVPLARIFEFPTIRGITSIILNTEKTAFVDLDKAEKKEYYPLSYHQKRLWYIQQAEPETTAFTLVGRIPLDHEVDPEIIKRTLNTLMARHESFRTYFRTLAEVPMQLIAQRVEVPLQIIDLSSREEEEKEQTCERIYDEEARTPSDITHVPIFRCLLVKLDNRRFVLIFSMNHISTDGWSMEIVRNEFSLLYDAYRTGKEIDLGPQEWQYKDFSQWQHRQLNHPVMREKSHRFWKEKLETGVSPLVVPGDFKGGRKDRTGAYWQFMIHNDLKEKLKHLADTTGTTLFMVMFSAYILLLSRFSHQDDIACSIIHSGRSHSALHRIMGFFVNSILFRTRLDIKENFNHMLQRVSKDTLEVFQHQNYPLELVCDELKMKHPEISVCFNMLHIMEQARREILEPYEPYLVDDGRDDAKFDIETYFIEFQNGMDVRWMYKKGLYKPGTMRHIIDRYLEVLDYFAEHPDKSYSEYRQEDKQERIW